MKKFLFAALSVLTASLSLAAVNINTASPSELEALPGIGPAKAKAIVDYRQQHSNRPKTLIATRHIPSPVNVKTRDFHLQITTKITVFDANTTSGAQKNRRKAAFHQRPSGFRFTRKQAFQTGITKPASDPRTSISARTRATTLRDRKSVV